MITERRRIILLSLILLVGCILVTSASIWTLYRADLIEQRNRLLVTAQSQARLIEAVARFDANFNQNYPGGPSEATMSQIIDAHENYYGFGETGEFTIARQVDDSIVFQFRHRYDQVEVPQSISFDSELAEPMRRALKRLSGTVVGLDYRGVTVMAAHEPIAELNLGIVAKIDMAEVRAPFIKAATLSGIIAALAVSIGVFLVIRVGSPLIHRLEKQTQALEKEIKERK